MTRLLAVPLLVVLVFLAAGPTAHGQEGVTTRSGHGITVSVSEPTGEDFPNGVSTPGGAIVGESVSGVIEHKHDLDWYRVLLEEGGVYEVTFEKGALITEDNVYLGRRAVSIQLPEAE